MSYSDLHLHVSLKQYISYKELWRRIKHLPQDGGKMAKAFAYNQSDLQTLIDADVKLAVAALHPLEKVLTERRLNRWLTVSTSGFLSKSLKRLYDDNKTYFKVLCDEYELLADDRRMNSNQAINLIADRDEIVANEAVKIVLAIEGAHSLQGDADPQKDKNAFETQIFDNLAELRKWKHPVFYITLAHFAKNHLVDQSWSIPVPGFLRATNSIRQLFCDGSPELKPVGRELIKELVDPINQEDRRIIVDLKHTHVNARFQVYDMLDKIGDTPVLVSHTGVSGIKTKELACEVKSFNNVHKQYDSFNPWEINLSDEDIIRIDQLKGMIGIMVDQRILGNKNANFVKSIKNSLQHRGVTPTVKKIHTALWVHNLFHVIQVLDKKEAWDRVCFGSDFDGIIDPIDSLPTANHLGEFEHDIVEHISSYFPQYERFLYGYTIEEALRKVLYSNLLDFVEQHFPAAKHNATAVLQ